MNILDNKRIIGVTAGFAVAFGVVAYLGYGWGQDFEKAKKDVATSAESMSRFNNAEFKPEAKTLSDLRSATKQARAVNKTVAEAMKHYSSHCLSNSKAVSTVEFERTVNGTIDKTGNMAATKGCNLAEPAKKLGMAAFTSASSIDPDEVPFRRFQLEAVNRVVTAIVDSGATSIEKIYCAPLPEGYKDLKDEVEYFPLSFEITFTSKKSLVTDGKTPGKMSPLPRIINAVCADKDFFLTPTGVSILSENAPAMVDAYQAPAPASEGQDFGSAGAAAQAPEAHVIATRKTGAPDDLIRVHINFQVLFFTGQKR